MSADRVYIEAEEDSFKEREIFNLHTYDVMNANFSFLKVD